MSTETAPRDVSPAALLFQKAHQKILMLDRLDEQLQQLLVKRTQLQEELRAVQAEINEEFDRMFHDEDELPPRLRATLHVNSKSQFATRPIDSAAVA